MHQENRRITATAGAVFSFVTGKCILSRENKRLHRPVRSWICTTETGVCRCAIACDSVQQMLIQPAQEQLYPILYSPIPPPELNSAKI